MFFSQLFAAEKAVLGFKKRKENNKQFPRKKSLVGIIHTLLHSWGHDLKHML
jgi:hypothetical protein